MPLAFRLLFLLVVLTLTALAHRYLWRRLVRDTALPAPARRALQVLSGTVLALGALSILLYQLDVPAAVALTPVFPLWLGLIINLLVLLLPLELVRLVRTRLPPQPPAPVSPERRVFLARAVATTTAVAGGGLTAFGAWRAWEPPRITEVPVRLPGLPRALEGFTLVHLTDLHVGPLLRERYLDELVRHANALRGDLVAITGDLVDGSTARLGGIVSRLSGLRSRHGTYFVTGNHDYASGADAWVAALQGLGVTVLRNRRVSIGDAGGSFDLLGVDDWGHGGGSGDYDLGAALAGRDPQRASVLLAHQPSNFEQVAREGVGLQLSGHTHGGQNFPATLIGQAMWGERNAGLSQVGGSQCFVSRGCGFVGPAQREGSPSEIIRVVLLPG